jgi:hypothetical protein
MTYFIIGTCAKVNICHHDALAEIYDEAIRVYSKMHIKILDETPFQSCPDGTCVHRSLQ